MAILDFSVSGWHGFDRVCCRISVSNFLFMSFVAVGRSLMIVSYVTFKMSALWFWTMFNCNPTIAHCHLFLWGGGILVDHWSTISSIDQLHEVCQVLRFLCRRHCDFYAGAIMFSGCPFDCIIGRSAVSSEDQLLCWNIDCIIGNRLYYWKNYCDAGRCMEDQWYY